MKAVCADRIFHITQPELWQAATERGMYEESTRGRSLADEGFIHCSFADQIEIVADLVYGDWTGDLVLLDIDTAHVDAEIRVENLHGGELTFPHIYGPLPTEAVTAIHRMAKGAAGWTAPDAI